VDQEGCKWVVSEGCQSTESPPKKSAAKPKPAKKKLAKKPAAKKKKKSLEELLEELKKLFQTSVDSDDKRDWDAFYKALNALYRDKFDLKKDETYYIANASKERNRPMQAHVISSYEDTTAFPVFNKEDLKVPYKKRNDAWAAAQAFVEMYGPDEDSYEKIRFSTGSPAREIARYISFLSRN